MTRIVTKVRVLKQIKKGEVVLNLEQITVLNNLHEVVIKKVATKEKEAEKMREKVQKVMGKKPVGNYVEAVKKSTSQQQQ